MSDFAIGRNIRKATLADAYDPLPWQVGNWPHDRSSLDALTVSQRQRVISDTIASLWNEFEKRNWLR